MSSTLPSCSILLSHIYHLSSVFADDSQLYLSFKPELHAKTQYEAVAAVENFVRDLRTWMLQDKLMINDDKID